MANGEKEKKNDYWLFLSNYKSHTNKTKQNRNTLLCFLFLHRSSFFVCVWDLFCLFLFQPDPQPINLIKKKTKKFEEGEEERAICKWRMI